MTDERARRRAALHLVYELAVPDAEPTTAAIIARGAFIDLLVAAAERALDGVTAPEAAPAADRVLVDLAAVAPAGHA